MLRTRSTPVPRNKQAKTYKHPESESPMRPEVGTQAEFKKKLPPKKYRYDDSLSPVLEWDGQNPARERGEARIAKAEAELADARKKLTGKSEAKEAIEHISAAQKAVSELKAMSKPFLNWAGKAERLSFDVPTLPLFIHERLSTKAILQLEAVQRLCNTGVARREPTDTKTSTQDLAEVEPIVASPQ